MDIVDISPTDTYNIHFSFLWCPERDSNPYGCEAKGFSCYSCFYTSHLGEML